MLSSKVTINNIAKEAGVSIATVSRFLNSPLSIKSENRKKVQKAVKKFHYKPLIYARRLAGGKLGVYGLIVPGYEGLFSSFYATEVIRGVGVSLEKFNIDLHLHIYTGRDRFNTSLVDGVIFADIIGNEEQFKRIVKYNLPAVVINKKVDDMDTSYITINNFKGAYQAVELLVSHGHKIIAHIAGDLNAQCAQERAEGYKSALIKNNIKVKDNYIKSANFSRLEARKVVEEFFSLSQPPTALFAASDEMAIEVVHFAHHHGIKVPEQLSVIGFDDNPQCRYEHIALTTVRQPLFYMATLAAGTLRKIIEKKEKPTKTVLDPELVIRDTVTFA